MRKHIASIASSKKETMIETPIGKRFTQDTYTNLEAYDELIVVKARLLRQFPFWGILSLSLVLVEDESGTIPTLCTDGYHIIYNAEFVMKLKRGERTFAIAHEIYHCLMEHVGRNNRSRYLTGLPPKNTEENQEKIKKFEEKCQLANFAEDFVVNDDLLQAECGEFITTIELLHNVKFRGWNTEEVFKYLVENPQEVPKGAKTMDIHVEVEIDDGGSGEGKNKSKFGKGSKKQKGKGDGDSGETNGNGNPIKIKMKREEYEKMKRDWQDRAVQAAAAQRETDARNGGEAGNLPVGVQRLLNDLTRPVYNWKQLLKRYVMTTLTYDYSFSRPNKALFDLGFTIPGFRSPDDMLDIVVGVDTSGSIGQEELTNFISEMNGILKAFYAYTIKIWCFDSSIIEDSITTITKTDGKMEDITKFLDRIGGGGGTNFEVNWEYMKEEKIHPKLFLMFTDGCPFGGWGDPLYCPTMFLILGNPGTDAPFGISMHYEDAL